MPRPPHGFGNVAAGCVVGDALTVNQGFVHEYQGGLANFCSQVVYGHYAALLLEDSAGGGLDFVKAFLRQASHVTPF
jgi:hypothetical protein